MPPPPSFLDITALPYSRVVTQAEFNGGTFGGVANEVWFRYVGGPIGFGSYTTSGGTFTPTVRLYENDGSTLIDEFVSSFGWWFFIPASDTYYLRVTRTGGGSSNFDFTVQAEGATVITTPQPGNIVINDDTQAPGTYPTRAMPATVWEIDGTFLGIMPEVPASEIGDALPSGISLWHDRFGANGAVDSLSLNDVTGAYVSSVSIGESFGTFFPCICHTDTDFYVLNRDTNNVFKVSDSGTVTGPLANLSATATISAFGISKNAGIGYWAEGTASAAIHKHNLTTDTPMADLYTIVGLAGNGNVALTALNLNPGEILCLADGSIVTFCLNTTTAVGSIVHISAAGALINKYDYATPTQVDHIAYAPNDPLGIHVWLFIDSPLGNNGRFGLLTLATGVLSPSFDRTLFEAGQNLNVSNQMFGPSASCTLVTLGLGGASTGTLEVIKVVIGTVGLTVFSFTAGGGLSPTSFTLADGESRFYTNLTPGAGYTIAETVPADWFVSYVVSNGSPINNLLVVAGDTTVVTVTNNNSSRLGVARRLKIRWLRRTPILSDENVRLFLYQLTLDIQTGVGLPEGQGSDPVVMMRYSIDSGWTWSDERQLQVGKIGEYFWRSVEHSFSAGRNYVFEFSGSDPVIVALIDLYFQATKGAH